MAGQTVDQRIKPGDPCEVKIGQDLVLTGYVFKAPISYDGRQISLSIEGSSKTQDLVDCAATNRPNQWQEQPLLSIVQALAAEYSLYVVNEIPETARLAKHTIVPGETVFQSIDRLLSLFRCFPLMTSRAGWCWPSPVVVVGPVTRWSWARTFCRRTRRWIRARYFLNTE